MTAAAAVTARPGLAAVGAGAIAVATGPLARVRVAAPARLHLGFLDPAATLGRRFGSIGLVLDGFDTVVELAGADTDRFEAFSSGDAALARAIEHLRTLRAATRCTSPVRLALRAAPPMHAGLGSGTQLALAVGTAFSRLFDLELASGALAAMLGRGARSGVGIAGFDQGGLLLDGGPQADGSPAALLARLPLPAPWRVIVALDPRVQGLSGTAERAALATLPPLPHAVSAEICHEALMRVLPGAAGAEFEPFAAGVSHIQRLLGDHFARAQQGRRFTSAAVAGLMDWLGAHAVAGIGQSSWGPAGFAIVRSAADAREVLASARAAGVLDPALEVSVTTARNRGAGVAIEAFGEFATEARPAD
jgi:beta-ribofuranosylaminobenzene 5'-phosphate synthase